MQNLELAMQLLSSVSDKGRYLHEALFAVARQAASERLSTFILQTYRRLVSAGLIDGYAPTSRFH